MAITTQPQPAPAPRLSTDASSVEEIDRGSIRVIPEGSVAIQPPPVLVNTAPWRFVFAFGGLALLDIAMNAAAGAAAAHVGAQLNGKPPTTQVLKMGALAGTTKAAITTFREVVALGSVNVVFQILLMLLTSSFGVCPLLVTEVGNQVLGGETPKEYVIAAVVAAIPLLFEMVRSIQPPRNDDGQVEYFRWVPAVLLIATDTLGGYVFARMAANLDMPISNYQAACSAGAVFGTIAWLGRAMTGCVAMVEITTDDGSMSNIFGVWELVNPDPVLVTAEEYGTMQRGLGRFFAAWFREAPRMARRMLKVFTCCCGCCLACCGVKDDLDEIQAEMAEMEEGLKIEAREMGVAAAQLNMPFLQDE